MEYYATKKKNMGSSWVNLKVLMLDAKSVAFYGSLMSYIESKLIHIDRK